ncbi:L-tyrosine/L-tryptophan isonitrile synthase family protein [Kutzneria buriramensis]|uniref:Pyoverdine/dityrosine biosynthesis protein n=1 Tax=Kutzneria buriramensis TaxID=1045776 RepID=A0A3E0GW62_9PSEU|nr:L-tyrosine/L-tryptophan isonitrile synthase family protein [Kutzneria buriramensis]REH31109.1 pyoverdine/dityrosine biosynthesis protein [Kutzneria buriramensis]
MHTLNSARSLAALDLAAVKTDTRLGHAVTLTDQQHTRLLLALRDRSAAAADQVAQFAVTQMGTPTATTVDEVATGFHPVLTHNRYRQGPRRYTTVAEVADKVRPFVQDGSPVPITIQGFPFKQHDNLLKASGPLPDLAEFGAMLRLWELVQALRQLYPPGVWLTVMRDGGYYRPRPSEELAVYRAAVDTLWAQIGDPDMGWVSKLEAARSSLGPQRAARWRHDVERYRAAIVEATSAAADTCDPHGAELPVRALTGDLPDGSVPSFPSLFASLLYSVAVPGPGDAEWSRLVLADPFSRTDEPSAAVRAARQELIRRAWLATASYLGTCAADARHNVNEALFGDGLHLSTSLPGPGKIGFSYLGGSLLYPWHGSACVDASGRLGVAFSLLLGASNLVPVHRDGSPQPFLWIPPECTVRHGGDRRVGTDLIDRIRLRSR